jgi:uracil-DNA glycosylase family 4
LIVEADGPRDAAVAVCGEAPGPQEIAAGRGFVGPSGKILWNPGGDNDLMGLYGYPRESVYVTNVTKYECNDAAWRALSQEERDRHVTLIRHELSTLLSLKVVVAIGVRACQALVPGFTTMTECHGRAVVGYDGLYVVLPVFHPAAYLRGNRDVLGYLLEDLGKIEGLVAGFDEIMAVSADASEVLGDFPETIAFLRREAAPKTAKCKFCRASGDLRRYSGGGLKWPLCSKHAIATYVWARTNLPALHEHASQDAAASDAARLERTAARMQQQLIDGGKRQSKPRSRKAPVAGAGGDTSAGPTA